MINPLVEEPGNHMRLIEGCNLVSKTTNKCQNMYEWMEMLERNKNGSLPTPAIL